MDRAAAHWVGDAVPDEVRRLRTAVGVFARRLGAPDALVEDVRLAVSEALSNAVMHAYPCEPGRVDTRASADSTSGLMTIHVRDYGVGCRPRSDSPGIGMGLPIMASLARTLDVAAPAGGGTDVELTFTVWPTNGTALL